MQRRLRETHGEPRAARRAEPPRHAALVALHAFGRGVLLGAVVMSASMALEVDFGVASIAVAAVMGFLGFAFVSAGEGLAVGVHALVRRILERTGRTRGAAAWRSVPPVPIGRIVGAFLYVAGDVLWPESFLQHVRLPVVGEIGIVAFGVVFTAVAMARLQRLPRAARCAWVAVPAVAILAVAWWVMAPGFDGYLVATPASATPVSGAPAAVRLDELSARGPYAVATLRYGSGTSLRRPEYGDGVDHVTASVDGSAIFDGYTGLAGAYYRWYWGFDFDALPLNGLVWYPEAPGPHPLVLVVHGNHAMTVPSETGYAYLGEHLASHGHVVVAVDQNFLNGLLFIDGRFAEIPLRAWLILEHLRQWRSWSETPDHPLAGLTDLDRIALVGHSRGGEAVAWAAHLDAYPMAPVRAVSPPSEYGFGIRTVVAIAPSDAYEGPGGQRPDLARADYLLLAGGHDADTYLLYGIAQANRTRVGDDASRIVAGAYLHRANHGQFNTSWGDRDRGLFNSLLLNRAPLPTGDAQRRAAQALVTSFLNASLRGESADLAPFRNPPVDEASSSVGAVVTQLRDASSIVVEGFEGAAAAAHAERVDGAAVEPLTLRDGEREQGNRALRLTWDAGGGAAFEVAVGPDEAEAWALGRAPSLRFALAAVPGAAAPRDVEIELATVDGAAARFVLDAVGDLAPPLPAHLVKARWLNGLSGFPPALRSEEVVLQTVTIPLTVFETAGDGVAPASVNGVRFRVGGTEAGAIYLDDVALVPE